MSKMSELHMDIQDAINEGKLSFGRIAEIYGVSRADVEAIYDEMMCMDMDCDDSDDGYALASAGFGTDEDYGYYGEE
jgi:predicted HTH domain antitoxin